MKKLIVVVVLVLALCLPVEADGLNLWMFGDNDAIDARFGWDVSENTEVGVGVSRSDIDKDIEVWNVYGIYEFPAVDFLNPIPVTFLPKVLSGRPYGGAQISLNIEDDSTRVSPIAGINFGAFFIENQFATIGNTEIPGEDENRFILGVKFEF